MSSSVAEAGAPYNHCSQWKTSKNKGFAMKSHESNAYRENAKILAYFER
jgi:hypothetical protein